MSTRYTPEPSQIDYHAEIQVRRVERALKEIAAGDVLSIIDEKVTSESDPAKHPLYAMVCWHLEKCLTPMDGRQFFDTCRQLVIDAINVCLDERLAREG
jgi:hypothetical protein